MDTSKRDAVLSNSQKDLSAEFSCPICLDTIKEAFVTRCGHSYCYLCIVKHLETKSRCPTCSQQLTKEQVFPNFMLNAILENAKGTLEQAPAPSPRKQFHAFISDSQQLDLTEIDRMLDVLAQKKKKIQVEEKLLEQEVTEALLEFLRQTKQTRLEKLQQVQKEIQLLEEDITIIEKARVIHPIANPKKRGNEEEVPVSIEDLGVDVMNPKEEAPLASPGVDLKKRRITDHFEDLQAAYLHLRTHSDNNPLAQFKDSLSKFARFSHYDTLATAKFGNNIVCSIEFDREGELFAAAGVTQKIRIFEYNTIIADPHQMHYPTREMSWAAKISCVKWNNYLKTKLLSSDYDGTICFWDVLYGKDISKYEEHTKRVWSIDFAYADPTRFASASDDAKVKIWSTTQPHSVATIEGKANMCCVQFNPESPFEVVAGSADHNIMLYDIRKPSEPVNIFKSHTKAVSYVVWMNKSEFVSASTDGTLKLWNVNQAEPTRTYSGHVNEKNFVGLSVNGDYITCGSENNSVYTYFKPLSKPVMQHNFDAAKEDDRSGPRQFISSVCWRKNSNVLVAGNSDGIIKILSLSE